jgi:DNA-binding MarR family transcriptional regulator
MATPSLATHAHLAAFSSLLARDAESSKLHMRDLQIIALLVAHRTSLSVGAIATLLDISSPHVSRVADKLVTRGLLKRVADKDDRRLALFEPTKAGRALDMRVRDHYAAATAPGAAA